VKKNIYLEKIAELSRETKRDIVNTGVVGLAGGVTGIASHKALSAPRFAKLSPVGKFGLATGIGLLGDYAAVKAMNAINKQGNK
jgi:hypothetical protein